MPVAKIHLNIPQLQIMGAEIVIRKTFNIWSSAILPNAAACGVLVLRLQRKLSWRETLHGREEVRLEKSA